MEHYQEAALWNDVFTFTREALGLPAGLIRATVLIETLPAAFQMAEIIHALGEHSYGLNAGRWDYIFSMPCGISRIDRIRISPKASN